MYEWICDGQFEHRLYLPSIKNSRTAKNFDNIVGI